MISVGWTTLCVPCGRSNRSGLGAWITVDSDVTLFGDTMVWEVNVGSHFLSQSESIVYFGLGDRTARLSGG